MMFRLRTVKVSRDYTDLTSEASHSTIRRLLFHESCQSVIRHFRFLENILQNFPLLVNDDTKTYYKTTKFKYVKCRLWGLN